MREIDGRLGNERGTEGGRARRIKKVGGSSEARGAD